MGTGIRMRLGVGLEVGMGTGIGMGIGTGTATESGIGCCIDGERPPQAYGQGLRRQKPVHRS